jgi:hypothetical protein
MRKEQSMATPDQTIDFRMYFSGLMVFDRQQDAVEALLIDARRPEAADIAGTERVPPHYPVVQFAWDDAVSDRRAFGKFLDTGGQLKGYWPLDADVLMLDPSVETVSDELEVVAEPARGRQVPANAEDARSFDWIAPLRGGLRQDLFQNGRDRRPAIGGELAATVRMTRGAVRPAAFASEFLEFVVLEFDGEHRQAIVSVVEHAIKVKGESVRLRAEKFNGEPGEVLELVPPRLGDRRVEVWMLNREWDQIEHQIPPHAVDFQRGNPDYLFFHQLVPESSRPRTLPRGHSRVGTDPAIVSPNLSPCHDPVMRRLYFPSGEGGELTLAAPCSPAVVKE